MNNKVLEVMRKVVAKPERIQESYKSSGEFFFRYNSFVFSVLRAQNRDPEFGPYSFYVYPNWTGNLAQLAAMSEGDPENLAMVSYDSGQFSEEDEKALFRDLYNVVQNKNLNVDMIFDNIIGAK